MGEVSILREYLEGLESQYQLMEMELRELSRDLVNTDKRYRELLDKTILHLEVMAKYHPSTQ